MKKVILDCDTGTDDALAVCLLIQSKQFDVLGITTVVGNNDVNYTSDNTLRVLDYLESDVKVYKGSSESLNVLKNKQRAMLKKEGVLYYIDESGREHNLHPKHLWLNKTNRSVEEENAIDFIINSLKTSNEKITLIVIGPATNIARAIIKDNTIVNNIEEIVFMGGSEDMGNVTPYAEANFFHDPEAIKVILESKAKITITTLNATKSCSLTVASRAKNFNDLNSKCGKLAKEILVYRADVEKHLGFSDGLKEPIHDPLAIAYLIDPAIFTKKEIHQVDIDCGMDKTVGSLIIDKGTGNKDCNLLLEASEEKYYQLLAKYFS